jgi:hypothetical protein
MAITIAAAVKGPQVRPSVEKKGCCKKFKSYRTAQQKLCSKNRRACISFHSDNEN